MFGLRLGQLGVAGGLPFSERALWPQGASSPGLWIDGPSYPSSCYQDSAGTTALSTVGTVLDSSNPVGLILDRKAGATSKTDPGIHLSQSTSAARPVASARANQITYSEDLSNAAWFKTGATASAQRITEDSSTGAHTALNGGGTLLTKSASVRAGAGTRRYMTVWSGASGTMYCTFDLQAGVITEQGAGVASASIAASTLGGYWCIVTFTSAGAVRFSMAASGTSGWNPSYAGDGAKYLDIYATQLEFGNPSSYQRVGAASDYTATGFPAYLKFDGVDDALSSATFPAGTLTSSMDCLIAVRRDSTADMMIGPYDSIVPRYFGWTKDGAIGSNSSEIYTSVWVDGVQLSGGINVLNGTLATALTTGSFHILEFRGMNLSAWTEIKFGNYTWKPINGAIGKIELFASGQDSNRDKARARMAAQFGVTLP